MPPLTTITMLVYDLVKVNPTTTLCRPSAVEKLRQPVFKKKSDKRLKKKSRQQLSDENRHGRHHAHSTAKPFCKMETSTDLTGHSASKSFNVNKRGNLQRLWISHLISTGWFVRKHELLRRPAFYTILLLAWYSDYARFILRVNDWSCWKKRLIHRKIRVYYYYYFYI